VAASGVFTVLVTSMVLSPGDRGAFATIVAAAVLVGSLGSASMWLGISIELARAPKLVSQAVALSLAWPALLAVLALPVFLWVNGSLGAAALAFGALGMVVVSYTVLQGVATGMLGVRRYAYADIGRAATSFALVACASLFLTRDPLLLSLAWGAGFLFGTGYLVRCSLPWTERPVPSWSAFVRPVLSRSLRFYPTDLLRLGAMRLDIVLLAALAGTKEVAYYSLAAVLAEGVWLVPGALAITTLADLPRLETDAARALTRSAIRHALVFACLAAVAIGVLGTALILIVLPSEYHAAIAPLVISLVGTLAFSVPQVAGPHIVVVMNRALISGAIPGVTLVLNVALLVALAPQFGAIGASVASAIAYATAGVLCLVAVASSGLGLRPSRRPG
jgi:O-antigen/teichoic acid export membrane protein